MGHDHHGHIHEVKDGRNLFITIVLNVGISIAEVVGGIFANSLSLISDALHNFSDSLAMLISYIALKISKRDANARNTFGYHRIQILAALFNSVTLIVISTFLIHAAYQRFVTPEEVNSIPMLIVATIGLIANFIGVFLLKNHSKSNLNIKSAYLHLIGDTLSSIAVIIGGILIYFFDLYWIDPLITVLISLYIIKETYSIVIKTYHILMQAVPKDLDILQITKEIELIGEIKDIHHIHAWSLNDTEIHFEAHANLNSDLKTSEYEHIIHQIERLLKHKYRINHVTLQMEFEFCNDNNIISNK
ncbi:MAG: cation transporter [Bacteroidetes bacterium]|nr:cation transporter [Bacteroidota bacterium]